MLIECYITYLLNLILDSGLGKDVIRADHDQYVVLSDEELPNIAAGQDRYILKLIFPGLKSKLVHPDLNFLLTGC